MKRHVWILTTVLLFSTIFFTFLPSVEAKGKISEGSGIANISLEGLKREEALQLLEQRIAEWQDEEPIEAESDYETVSLPREIFKFNTEATLDELEERTKRHWSNFFIKPKNIKLPLQVELITDYSEWLQWNADINEEATLENALRLAENLDGGVVTIIYEETAVFETVEIASLTLPLPEASVATIRRLVEELNEQTLSGEEAFSFLKEVVLPAGMANSELEMSFVASALYILTLQTELEIIERHASATIPSFTEPGLEAMVDREAEKNLLIYNPSTDAYMVEAEVVDDELVMSIHSMEPAAEYDFTIENEKEIEPRTIYRYNPLLRGEEQQVIHEGTPGLQLEIHRERMELEGGLESTELISRDFYPPEHRVVEVAYETEEEAAEEQEESEPETDTTRVELPSIFNPANLEDKVQAIESCAGDAECEEALEISPAEKLVAACFTETTNDEEALDAESDNEDNSNPLCDFMLMTLFFYMMNQDLPSESDVPVEDEIDVESLLEDEDIQQEDTEGVE